jgi:predicted ester cyclase
VTKNQDVVREFYAQAINGRDPSACKRLLTADFTHNGEQRGRGGQSQAVEAFLDAFSPLHNEILIIFGEEDLVCAHQRWSGKHVGEFLGHPATGRDVSFTSTAILRLRDGQISEAWDEMDAAGLLAQIG